LVSSLVVQAQMDSCALESEVHALERVPAEGRAKPAQFIPIRFVFTNKLNRDDKLLLALDAFALSKLLGREVSIGRIVHGDDHSTLKVKTSPMISEVRKRLERIATLLSNPAPPDLVLNPHCPECEFQARCRRKAEETDDLSLLSNMSAKERKKFHTKGIFTVEAKERKAKNDFGRKVASRRLHRLFHRHDPQPDTRAAYARASEP
jgi:predicted RecB family nuclease